MKNKRPETKVDHGWTHWRCRACGAFVSYLAASDASSIICGRKLKGFRK